MLERDLAYLARTVAAGRWRDVRLRRNALRLLRVTGLRNGQHIHYIGCKRSSFASTGASPLNFSRTFVKICFARARLWTSLAG